MWIFVLAAVDAFIVPLALVAVATATDAVSPDQTIGAIALGIGSALVLLLASVVGLGIRQYVWNWNRRQILMLLRGIVGLQVLSGVGLVLWTIGIAAPVWLPIALIAISAAQLAVGWPIATAAAGSGEAETRNSIASYSRTGTRSPGDTAAVEPEHAVDVQTADGIIYLPVGPNGEPLGRAAELRVWRRLRRVAVVGAVVGLVVGVALAIVIATTGVTALEATVVGVQCLVFCTITPVFFAFITSNAPWFSAARGLTAGQPGMNRAFFRALRQPDQIEPGSAIAERGPGLALVTRFSMRMGLVLQSCLVAMLVAVNLLVWVTSDGDTALGTIIFGVVAVITVAMIPIYIVRVRQFERYLRAQPLPPEYRISDDSASPTTVDPARRATDADAHPLEE